MAPSSASQLAPRPVPSAPPRQGLLIAKKRSGGALLGPGRRFAEGGTVSHGAEVPIPFSGQVARNACSLVVQPLRTGGARGLLAPPRPVGPRRVAGWQGGAAAASSCPTSCAIATTCKLHE